jgi:hypothetical protein
VPFKPDAIPFKSAPLVEAGDRLDRLNRDQMPIVAKLQVVAGDLTPSGRNWVR